MKKNIFISILLTLVAVGTFAQDLEFWMSAGGGSLFDWNGSNGYNYEINNKSLAFTGYQNLSIGGFAFFDIALAEIDISFAYGKLSGIEKGNVKDISIEAPFEKASILQLCFSLLGKYPFYLGRFTIFPLYGIDFNWVLSVKGEGIERINDSFSQLGFLFGMGFDYLFFNFFFFRFETMIQFRGVLIGRMPPRLGGSIEADKYPTFGVGPRIKVGIGYKFHKYYL